MAQPVWMQAGGLCWPRVRNECVLFPWGMKKAHSPASALPTPICIRDTTAAVGCSGEGGQLCGLPAKKGRLWMLLPQCRAHCWGSGCRHPWVKPTLLVGEGSVRALSAAGAGLTGAREGEAAPGAQSCRLVPRVLPKARPGAAGHRAEGAPCWRVNRFWDPTAHGGAACCARCLGTAL